VCSLTPPNPHFPRFLFEIDRDFADQLHFSQCHCGGVLHRANYPRKPRGCPDEARGDYQFRFSFCCSRCRRRTTAKSVRFLGRRVYLGLTVVLTSARAATNALTEKVADELGVPISTLQRWRQWWKNDFSSTHLWQTECAQFALRITNTLFPANLLDDFKQRAANPSQALIDLLSFLAPMTVKADLVK